MKYFLFISILALMFCAALPSRADPVDGIAALVNGTVITAEQVREFAAPAIEALQGQYPAQSDALRQKLTTTFNDALEQLIERQLILDDFTAEGYRLPDSLWDEWVQERIRAQPYDGDRSLLMKTLQAQGETFEQFRKDVRDQNIETFMRSKKVAQEIIISPYKVEEYYKSHTNDFKVGDEVKLRLISINKSSPDDTNAVALAGEVLAKIKNGASFAEMAVECSQDSLRSQGGERGWVERSVLRKELADAVGALAPGQVSGVIDLPDACYIMLVEDKHPAHVKPLNEVRDDIQKTLRAQEQSRLQKQWIDQLKAKAFIRYY
jgi:peptidyl-prolyl cis-trans isomerase SurA